MTSRPLAWAGRRKPFCPLGVAAALFALALPPTSAAAHRPPAFDKVMAKATELMEKGQYQKAIGKLEALGLPAVETRYRGVPAPEVRYSGEFPVSLSTEQSVRALLYLTVCFHHIGEPATAASYARAAVDVAVEPAQRVRAYNALAASALMERQARINGVERDRGSRLLDRQLLEESEAALRQVLRLTGGQAHAAHFNLGEVLRLQGRDPEAQRAFAAYLEREPDGEFAGRAKLAMDCTRLNAVRVGGDVAAPRKTSAANPQYTAEARGARIEGVVVIEATIDKSGVVRCVRVLKGLPLGLSEAAADAIARSTYEPATLQGEPVAVLYNLTISFNLQ